MLRTVRQARQDRSSKSPLEKAQDTRRAGLVFLVCALALGLATLIGYVANGMAASTMSTLPTALTFLVIGAAMYSTGRRELTRLGDR